jgi:hypothetical protein
LAIGPTIENLRKKRAEDAALLEMLYALPTPTGGFDNNTPAELAQLAEYGFLGIEPYSERNMDFGRQRPNRGTIDVMPPQSSEYYARKLVADTVGERRANDLFGYPQSTGSMVGDMIVGEGLLGDVGKAPFYAYDAGADLARGDYMDAAGNGLFALLGGLGLGELGAGARGAKSAMSELPEDVRRLGQNVRGFLANESGAVPLPSKTPKTPKTPSKDGDVKAPAINKLDPNEWRQRLEASLPAVWLDPKFDKPQWSGISNVASDLPPSAVQPILRSTGTLEPEAIKTIEGFVGRTAIPAFGDRSIAGNEILGIGNLAYQNAIRSLGGADFMREKGTGIWANAAAQAAELAKTADEVIRAGGDPALVFTAMGPQSADFSTMMAEAVLNQYDPRMIDPKVASKYDEAVKKEVPKFTSILNPNFLDGLTGTDRWNLWQLMDKAELKKAGFPDINLARRSITDPRLLNAVTFDSGLTIGRPTGGLLSPDYGGLVPHPTYPTQLAGAYEGGLERGIAGPILWRDFFNQRRASGASSGSDQRSFLMNANRIKQNIDQQTIDEANQFFEQLRGINDPTDPLRLWRGLLSD